MEAFGVLCFVSQSLRALWLSPFRSFLCYSPHRSLMASQASLLLQKQLKGTIPLCHPYPSTPRFFFNTPMFCICVVLPLCHDWLSLFVADLCKNPVDGFSAGLVDETNIFEWSVTIIGPPDTL